MDNELLVTDVDSAALRRATTVLLVATGVIVADVRIDGVDLVSDPVGYLLVWIGLRRVGRATPRTPFLPWSQLGAAACLAIAVVIEANLAGGSAVDDVEPVLWLAQTLGVLALGGHLRRALPPSLAADWHRVVVASLVEAPLLLLAMAMRTSDAATVPALLAVAVTLVAGVLLIVALLRTRRAAAAAASHAPVSEPRD